MNLDDSLHEEISKLCEQGDKLAMSDDYKGALRLYHRSWNLLPEPKEDWEAATWILSAIGDAHYFTGDFANTMAAMSNALACPDGLGNPFIHLRLGEAAFELGDLDRARDELTRAYMGAGKEIFSEEDPKYLAYLNTVLKPMQGNTEL
jgi:tetratricopeptide (TPR) repeat protein